MRFIPTRIHGALDYALGIVLAALPYVAGFADRGIAEWASVILGCGLIIYSLLTNYELGVVRVIPMRLHLMLDAAGGAVLIVAALVSGAAAGIWVPLVILGLIEIGSSLMTRTVTSDGEALSDEPALAGLGSGLTRSGQAMPAAAGPRTAEGRPAYPTRPDQAQNVEQVRGAIDSGRTSDKVAALDPAAAPLGSDAETSQPHDEAGLRTARKAGASSR